MTDQEHIQLLIDFQLGKEDAFEQVFKLFYKSLRMQAFLILKNEEEAEDQVQQLFLDIWNKQLYRNAQQSLKAYLHIAIRNRCFNYLTKANRENRMLHEYTGYDSLIASDHVSEPSVQPYLLRALNELPAQRFKAFVLVHIQDKKYHEAAKEMGISINSLKSHLKLAVKSLRVRLQR